MTNSGYFFKMFLAIFQISKNNKTVFNKHKYPKNYPDEYVIHSLFETTNLLSYQIKIFAKFSFNWLLHYDYQC